MPIFLDVRILTPMPRRLQSSALPLTGELQSWRLYEEMLAMTARTRLLSVRHLTLLVGMVATLAGFAWLLSAQDTTPPGFQAYA